MIDEQTKALVAATLTAAILGKDPHTAHSPEQAVSKFNAVFDALESSLASAAADTTTKVEDTNELLK